MTNPEPLDVGEAVDLALDALLDAQAALSYVRFNVDARHARRAIERAERHLESIADPPPDHAA